MEIVSSKDLEKFKKIAINEKNIIRIAKFIADNFKHLGHSFEYKYFYYEQTNIFNSINSYGYGNCKHYSFLFAFIMDLMKVKNELLYINSKKNFFNHVVNLINFKGTTFYIDCDLKVIQDKNKLIPFHNSKLN